MTITVNTKAYNMDAAIDANGIQYAGPNHTLSSKDLLVLRRTVAKAATDTSPGFARGTAKFTKTETVGGKPYDIIFEGSWSIPVGVTKAQVDAVRDDLGDLLIATAGDDLVWKQDINQ